MPYETEREIALETVLRASRLCRSVQADLVEAATHMKKDRSPVTVADFGAQAVVSHDLMTRFPGDRLVGEEDASELREPSNEAIRRQVVTQVGAIHPELSADQVLAAIDHGTYEGGPKGRHWTLDPIDGTKGFLRGDQYAVALALIEEGEVVLGVLGCPNLPHDATRPDGERGCVFVATKGEGTTVRTMEDAAELPIRVTDIDDPARASFCESVEKAHSSQSDSARVAALLGIEIVPFRIDSQCKYAAVARGDASIYLRLPTRKGYEEKIWDHAAGSMVITEAGGRVTDVRGDELDFSIGRTLRDNLGVIVTNGRLHDRVVDAVRSVLGV